MKPFADTVEIMYTSNDKKEIVTLSTFININKSARRCQRSVQTHLFFENEALSEEMLFFFFDLFLHIQSPLDRYRDFGDTRYIIMK